MPVEQARLALADRTVMDFDPDFTSCITVFKYPTCTTQPGHGTQIEYFAPDGYNFLWYPGNARPVYGVWKLVRDKEGTRYRICFRYQSDSYNSLTQTEGGSWECRAFGPHAAGITEHRKGDVFDLASGSLPHPLSRKPTTFDELLANIAARSPAAVR